MLPETRWHNQTEKPAARPKPAARVEAFVPSVVFLRKDLHMAKNGKVSGKSDTADGDKTRGRFRQKTVTIWRRRYDAWDGYMIIKRPWGYSVLCEDDGSWGELHILDTEAEAKEFIVQENARRLGLARDNAPELPMQSSAR